MESLDDDLVQFYCYHLSFGSLKSMRFQLQNRSIFFVAPPPLVDVTLKNFRATSFWTATIGAETGEILEWSSIDQGPFQE